MILERPQQNPHPLEPRRADSVAHKQLEISSEANMSCLCSFHEADFPPAPLSVCLEAVESVWYAAGVPLFRNKPSRLSIPNRGSAIVTHF